MESWVLEGDNYSFLRSAPRNINLRQRDRPNRVEIFDITNLPSPRSAISETTCLCDIFGDDSESPSLSSSPASTSCLRRDVDVHLPAEDVNDSSGSYHTAHSSEQLSDTSDTFEESKDTISLKCTKDLVLPETRESSSPATDLTLSNDKAAVASDNGSPSSTKVDKSDLSQVESHQNNLSSQGNAPIQKNKNTDSSAQQPVMSMSEYRDTNIRVTDSPQETIRSDLLSETSISKQSDTASSELRDISSPPTQQDSPFSDNQLHTVTHEPLDKSSLVITKSEISPEENNVVSYPGEDDALPDLRSSSTESFSPVQEAATSDCSTDLNLSPGSRDPTPIQSCPSTPNSSIRASTPDLKENSSSTLMDTNVSSECDVTSKPMALVDSSGAMRFPSSPLEEDIAWLPDEPATVTTPSEENAETNISFVHQHPAVSPETREVSVSPDTGRLSFLSDTIEIPGSAEGSDICSIPDSLLAAHSSEPSVVIHSPLGYTISPSPEFGRTVFSAEPEAFSSTPEIPETEYTATPSDFRGSVSSPDSKLCFTPESRSTTSTPTSTEMRHDFLTADSTATAPSPKLMSTTCSPEIRAITCSVLSQNSKSPQIQGITYRVVAPQNQVIEQYPNEGHTLTTHSTDELRNLDNSTICNASLVPEDKSRPSSTTLSLPGDAAPSPETRDQRTPKRCSEHIPDPEPCNTLGQTDSHQVTGDELDIPSFVPADSCSLALNECKNLASEVLSPSQTINNSKSEKLSDGNASVKHMSESAETMNESILESMTHEKSNSLNSWYTSKTVLTAPIAEERDSLEGNDSCSGSEMLGKELVSTEKSPGHMHVRPRESPSVVHSDNDRKHEDQPCRNEGWSEERVVQQESTSGKRAESIAECSYRGEQLELSFRDRNSKGPASYSAAPSGGDPKSGIPARCYFESPLTTRQQQSLLRAQGAPKENKSGARRVQTAFQSKHGAAGSLLSGCTSQTSSMRSEFDEADNEVKWFTDLAFRSLSSPQGDYLDVYSSSHRSSTNVSQPSTVDSPGAATWMSYADLRGSTSHENDHHFSHNSSFLPHGTLDPTKRFEMGSFECVDVAVESKEEYRRGKRTVPKRQIQLKRRNLDESKSTENAGNVLDSPSTQRRSKDTLFRQHSTPAAVQENIFGGEPETQTDKKMLQKSSSFDETSAKTKMASCIINSVLSKKMEIDTKESSRSDDSSPSENKKKHPETLSVGPSTNIETHSLSSSLPSECSLSSEDFAGRGERSPCIQKRCGPKVPPKPFFKANFIPAYSNSSIVTLQGKASVNDQMRPRIIDPFEGKIHKKQTIRNNEKEAEASNLEEKDSCDSTNTTARNTSVIATRAASTHGTTANKDLEDPTETHKQQHSRRMFLSKTPEITLKPCTIKDKKCSLEVPLPLDHLSEDSTCEFQPEETPEGQMRFKQEEDLENEEDNGISKPKHVIHKVRDVRKLVKNTYNLSFKASNNTLPVEDLVNKNNKEMLPPSPHALHIECKAVSWKDKQASGNKTSDLPGKPAADKSETKMDSEKNKCKNKITEKPPFPKGILESEPKAASIQVSDVDSFLVSNQCNPLSATSENCEQTTNLEMPPRPVSKESTEISTLLLMQDGTSTAMQKPASPLSPDGKTVNSSHSVSMLLKEKGMQADIGVCDVLNEATSAAAKHINRLEVPLQICASEGISNESQKGTKEEADLLCEQKTDSTLQACQSVSLVRSSPKLKELGTSPGKTPLDNVNQAASLQSWKEDESMTNPATSVTKISAPLATTNKVEVRSFSSNTKSHAMPVTTSKEIELPIQVRSISSDRPKTSVPPKPSYKQPFTEIRSISSDFPKTDLAPTTSIFKQQTHLKSDVKKNETSAAVTPREQSTEAASTNTKKLAVSAVSSYKPPSIPVTTVSSSVQKSTKTSGGTDRQHESATSVQNSSNRQQLNMTVSQERVMPSSHIIMPVASQGHTYKPFSSAASSNNQLHKEDFLYQASDDPPSYDERESFSPLLLSDLPPRKLNRYHPSNKPTPCSCPTAPHPHVGHPYHGSQNRTPPSPQSPGQGLSYPSAPPQAQVRPHQCRQDGQPLNYPTVSPKTTASQAPAMIQPLHHSYPCPAPVTQPFGDEQQPASTQQMDRHSSNRPSPHTASGAAYCVHNRSPNIALDSRSQFFGAHDLPPAFGHDYGSDGPGSGSVLYPENASGLGYGQGPRRVLLDPETGKYFYIEVPMQPLRKMLFDPEIGQYVEVLIPQQAMSHSGMYPPTSAPYPSIHGPGLYAPQYLPYAAPLHSQSAQQPQHPESSTATSLHQTSMAYGSSASQTPKSEAKSHPSLDQSYLESMYYIPTGMNASPNSTPSDCYHKRSPNMPATGGRRA